MMLGWGLACAPAGPAPGTAPAAVDAGGGARGAAASPAPRVHLKIPFSQVSTSNVAWFVAQDGGIFERNGLDVELVNLGAGQPAQAALLSGEVVVTASSGPAAVNAIAAGANVVIVSVSLDTLPFQLVAVPEIKAIPDLRGATI